MQQSDIQLQTPQQFPLNFSAARESLKKLRRNLSNSFRRFPKAKSEATVSPYTGSEFVWSGLPTFSPSASIRLFPESQTSSSSHTMDGATDRMFRRHQMQTEKRANVSAIFVHAGAGYHSTQNEHIHLGACESAAKIAIRILRAGGSAVDAVEAAIKVLEDKEITNAGYGSNLSIDGVVECDATIVDSLGRSGACGATAQIKNPINLARIILDASSRPLSLKRVPPNLLIGQGATDFAYEQGIPVVPHDMLVSRSARERYVRWRDELRRADDGHSEESRMTPTSSQHSSQAEEEKVDNDYTKNQQRRDQRVAIRTGTWNEGQPDSPQGSPGPSRDQDMGTHEQCTPLHLSPSLASPPKSVFTNPNLSPSPRGRSPNPSPAKRPRVGSHGDERRTHSLLGPNAIMIEKSMADVGMTQAEIVTTEAIRPGQPRLNSHDGPSSPNGEATSSYFPPIQPAEPAEKRDEDMITDTVGAIAIDMYGNIAAGSSSGGIGMKHRGRVGPAALVGIGSAVVPTDPRDEDGVSVASVTSGTGEHMATTMASQKCAERLYHNTRRAIGGADIEATEEEAILSFVDVDFMSHPGVIASNSTGAIGVMAVKKTAGGYFLHFAHNTDSFALASMSSNEKSAHCVMSRLGDSQRTVRGGRKYRID